MGYGKGKIYRCNTNKHKIQLNTFGIEDNSKVLKYLRKLIFNKEHRLFTSTYPIHIQYFHFLLCKTQKCNTAFAIEEYHGREEEDSVGLTYIRKDIYAYCPICASKYDYYQYIKGNQTKYNSVVKNLLFSDLLDMIYKIHTQVELERKFLSFGNER